jgi:hypothetical protein
MANTAVISRAHLIYGVCLPLAVLVGYLLAEPLDSGSIAVVVLVLSILSIPILMRWHHALLIFSCNAVVLPLFVPGQPSLWMMMAAISMGFLVLNRAIGREVPFFKARQVSVALIILGAVVFLTAYATGGIGFAVFGSSAAGGKRYISIFCGIFIYFGLSCIPIERKYAKLAVAVFFLSSLTWLVGYLAAFGGPSFYFLVELFPIEGAVSELTPSGVESSGIARFGTLTGPSVGLFCFAMALYGVRGVLDVSRPWRLGLFLLAIVANLYSGFRSNMILCAVLFVFVFYFEGLFRTRYFLSLALGGLFACAILLPYTQKLPLVVQRTLAFLPLNIDPVARFDAQGSTEWRLEMWKQVLPTVPRYLLKGKGYALDMDDVYLMEQQARVSYTGGYEGSMLAGDYHSGPLSVIIPFGLAGVFAFCWFLFTSLKVLRQNYCFGEPEFRRINTFLYAYFIARILIFLFIFGSLYSDLAVFAGLIGLSVSINGGVCQPQSAMPEPVEPAKNDKPVRKRLEFSPGRLEA